MVGSLNNEKNKFLVPPLAAALVDWRGKANGQRGKVGGRRAAAAVDPCGKASGRCSKASGRRAAVGRRRREENGGHVECVRFRHKDKRVLEGANTCILIY